MKGLRTAAIITVLAVLTLGLSACTTFDNFESAFITKDQDNTAKIQIGVLEPITGADSADAEDEIRGIQLANKLLPNVDGKIVELVFADDKSDIDATETAIQTLAAKKPTVILGSYGSVYSLAAAPFIEDAKIPAISVTNTNPLVTKNYDYYFRVRYVDANEGDLLARYVLEGTQEKTVGVLRPRNNDVSLAATTSFTDRIQAELGDDAIAAYETYETGADDFKAVLNAISKTGVKVVFLPGEYTDAANIINQAADMKLGLKFIGRSDWNTQEFADGLHKNVMTEDLAFVQFFMADGEATTDTVSEKRQAFLDAFADEYGDGAEPSDSFALGYDAYCMAIDAIDKAKDESGNAIRKILATPGYQFEGVSGIIKFNVTGDPVKTAYITTWSMGSAKTLYTVEPTQ